MFRQATRTVRRPPAHRLLLPLCALVATLLASAVAPALAGPRSASEAGRLRASLTRSSDLVTHRLRPPALRLARGLPGEAKRLAALREPASTTQAQIGIVLGELRQVSLPGSLDPHYLPALIAAGRAYAADTGADPLTGSQVDPQYAGLAAELTASEARMARLSGEAGEFSAAVRRLSRELAQERRRAGRLERLLHASGAATRRRS